MAITWGYPPRQMEIIQQFGGKEAYTKPCATLKTSRTEPAPSPYLQGDSRHRNLDLYPADENRLGTPDCGNTRAI